jgi:hypothetical protein
MLAISFISFLSISCSSYRALNVPDEWCDSKALTVTNEQLSAGVVLVENDEYHRYFTDRLIERLRRTNIFSRVDLLESSAQEPDIVVTPQEMKTGFRSPASYIDLFFACGNAEHGDQVILESRRTDRTATVSAIIESKFVIGLFAIPFNFSKKWRLKPYDETEDYINYLRFLLSNAIHELTFENNPPSVRDKNMGTSNN